MNRKERRAGGKTGDVPALFAAAVQHHHAGRLTEAEALYRHVLAADPRHAASLHRLGVMAHQSGQHAAAAALLRKAIALEPATAAPHAHLGLALGALGRPDEAAASLRHALSLDASVPDTHNNLGVLLLQQDRPADAAMHFRAALALAPDLPEAHNNLGDALLALGETDAAMESWRQAIALAPAFPDAHNSLGNALWRRGQVPEAATHYRAAAQAAPGAAEVWNNLALAQLALDDRPGALAAIVRALALGETPDSRRSFVHVVKDMRLEGQALRPLLLRALREGWDRPDDLAKVCADIVLDDGAHPDDELLQALLVRTPNLDWALEQHLTAARRGLLAGEVPPDFAGALARQCFINEYVFACGEDELAAAQALRDRVAAALESGAEIAPAWIVAVAAYLPLSSAPGFARLLDRRWPETVEAILTQQLREPMEERRLRATIPRLTEIADPVSVAVRAQYEENPYPRWIAAGTATPQNLQTWLRQAFPHAVFAPRDTTDILVAGCGTGRNAVETTQKFADARTLAVDLSLSSLAYAARKTRERGLRIDYAQADLLALGDRRFDLVEAVGVLHHLADPFAGWRVLLSLLRPGGVMMLGLYSQAARRDVRAARAHIAARGFGAGDIRRARQSLMQAPGHRTLAQRPDFFTTSTCRDLLFHVQEHQMTLADLADFLRGHDLTLLGFALDDSVLAGYRRRFPDDPAATDMDHWQAFEAEHPDTFSGMYQFWVHKAPAAP